VVIFAQEGKALAVGREGDGTVDILDEQTGRAAEHGGGVERGESVFGLVAAHAINIVGVGREGEPCITGGCGRNKLRIAGRSDVSKPERLQSIFIVDVEKVFAVGGNGGESDVS